ncbi:MAG: amylovoran biosynthesis protein AmsE [Chloroflexi bacterium]|nr:amylovoran biosynthesis protein AmsE [Chloroflexota bacterium]|tara:strand:- start:2873 stop:3703 length:831 start_codon:yes stop_codon:yes gene_type:complete
MNESGAFSVLMSVYQAEKPENLTSAVESVFSQELCPAELVLVKDGPLTPALDQAINRLAKNHPALRVVALSRNRGLGAALNIGLTSCTYDLVARMDSDDLCTADRFAKQIPLFDGDRQLAVVGGWVGEFDSDPSSIFAVRRVPESSAEIERYARRRCPVNHPSVVFRKSAVLAVGGYSAKHLQEDYYLWARLMLAGFRFFNVPNVVVLMRTGEGLYTRRGGLTYALAELKLFVDFYRMRFVGLGGLAINVAERSLIRLMPTKLRKLLYQRFARSRP